MKRIIENILNLEGPITRKQRSKIIADTIAFALGVFNVTDIKKISVDDVLFLCEDEAISNIYNISISKDSFRDSDTLILDLDTLWHEVSHIVYDHNMRKAGIPLYVSWWCANDEKVLNYVNILSKNKMIGKRKEFSSIDECSDILTKYFFATYFLSEIEIQARRDALYIGKTFVDIAEKLRLNDRQSENLKLYKINLKSLIQIEKDNLKDFNKVYEENKEKIRDTARILLDKYLGDFNRLEKLSPWDKLEILQGLSVACHLVYNPSYVENLLNENNKLMQSVKKNKNLFMKAILLHREIIATLPQNIGKREFEFMKEHLQKSDCKTILQGRKELFGIDDFKEFSKS